MKTTIISLASLFLMGSSFDAKSQVLDQSQLNYEAGHSARNLPGSSTWQSFTAGITGTLSSIDQGYVNPMSGTATLNLYHGTGTGGQLLHTQGVSISGTGTFWQTFTISAPVFISAGQTYTCEVVPTQGGGLPDPYAVQISGPDDPYPAGRSSFSIIADYVFRTFVSSSVGIGTIETNAPGLRIQPNPFSTQTVLHTDTPLRNASLIVYNSQGQQVKQMDQLSGETVILQRDNLPSGFYFFQLSENNTTLHLGKLVVTDQ